MTKTTSFSFIIPVLNEEKLLPSLFKNIEKIRNNETGYRTEIIIADGGSTDNSVAIAREYADQVIDVSKEEINNIASGRNAGALSSSGDILVFCNADIIFDETGGLLNKIVQKFEGEPELIAMAAWVETFPGEEKLIDRLFHTFYNHYFRLLNLLGVGMGRGECIVVKRETFFNAGGFDDSLPAGEDFDLFNKLIRLGKVKYTRSIKVYESPRRFREYGYLKVTALWTLNATSVYFRKRSVSTKWKQVR